MLDMPDAAYVEHNNLASVIESGRYSHKTTACASAMGSACLKLVRESRSAQLTACAA